MREMIADGTIMVDTSGGVVGQINGLAVLDLGDYAFGGRAASLRQPSRAGRA